MVANIVQTLSPGHENGTKVVVSATPVNVWIDGAQGVVGGGVVVEAAPQRWHHLLPEGCRYLPPKKHISFSIRGRGQVSTILHSKAYLLHGKAKEIEEVEVVSMSIDGQIPLDISLDAVQVEQDNW